LIPFTPEQTAAAKQLKDICDTLHAEIVVIGAMAYLSWIEDHHRHTLDIDVAVTVDLDDYQRLVTLLRTSQWEQEPKREHRWTTPDGVRIDIIPAGPALRASNVLEWPISGMRMSLVGFEHVFKDSIPHLLGSDLILKVIPLPVVALLKIVSYEDDPDRRQKDMQDFAAILKRFDPDDTRRFGDDFVAAGLEYELTGAFLIGKDLGSLCSPEEGHLLVSFIAKLRDTDSRSSQLFRRAIESEFDDSDRPLPEALIKAFESGLQSQEAVPVNS
jgi:predicted nucleotidyltransferase